MNWQKILIGLIAISISAYISITLPISESGIPFTGQSLAVFVVAAILNSKEVKITMLSYFLLGIVGLPVFADGTSGIEKVMGASGGFLYGFFFAGLFISVMIARFKPLKLPQLALIFLAATLVLFVFGLGHLAYKFNFEKALEYGLYPFWKMAIVKALLATLIIYFVKKDIIA